MSYVVEEGEEASATRPGERETHSTERQRVYKGEREESIFRKRSHTSDTSKSVKVIQLKLVASEFNREEAKK